ncbi:MAG TPA: S1 RNA-binding domain-containing protein, partial [Intrasporangium sp.]|nr:S1 RNA-binding domain-containing protein [Intrasporangium sp.]
HVSALSHRFVSDPREVVKPGDVVRCKVLDVDLPRKRISLTLRLDDEVTQGGGQSGKRDRGDRGDRGGRQSQGKGAQRDDRPADSAMADALRRAGYQG